MIDSCQHSQESFFIGLVEIYTDDMDPLGIADKVSYSLGLGQMSGLALGDNYYVQLSISQCNCYAPTTSNYITITKTGRFDTCQCVFRDSESQTILPMQSLISFPKL
jgi:hypothetical protein